MKKNIMTVLCAGVLLGALCAPVSAVDPLYSGPVDAITGDAISSSAEESTRVLISGATSYDRKTGTFVYPVGSGAYEVRANVADGMIVNTPVSITADDGVALTVVRNGTELKDAELDTISKVGAYAVNVGGVEAASELFSFTIVGTESNLSGGYAMPEGFYILDATLDGEEAVYDRNYIGMESEGLYEIEYVCPASALHYHLTITIDRTPPQITLEGKTDKKGRFHSAVQVGGVEPGSSVALTRDGTDYDYPSDGSLSEAGMYVLQVFDQAGNTATEQFTVLAYLNLSSFLFFAALALSGAAVASYVVFQRKRFKIS